MVAMVPLSHISNARIGVLKEGLDPSVLGIADGEAEGSIKGVVIIAMGKVGQAGSGGAGVIPPGEPFGGAQALAFKEPIREGHNNRNKVICSNAKGGNIWYKGIGE